MTASDSGNTAGREKTIRQIAYYIAAVVMTLIAAVVLAKTGLVLQPVVLPVPELSSRDVPQTPCYLTPGGVQVVCGAGGSFVATGGGDVQVLGNSEIRVEEGGSLMVGSGSAISMQTGSLLAAGQVALLNEDFTPTAGQVLTPTLSMYTVKSSGAVSMTLGAPVYAGKVLLLYGVDDNTVTVNDVNLLSSDGNAVTFGQYDLVQFVSGASSWVLVSKSANQ